MPQIVHIVLMKISDSKDATFTNEWQKLGESMLGKIPGLTTIKCGTCIEGSKHRTAGWTHMLYSIFDDEKSLRVRVKRQRRTNPWGSQLNHILQGYATHPVHVELLQFGEGAFTDKLVFDLEI